MGLISFLLFLGVNIFLLRLLLRWVRRAWDALRDDPEKADAAIAEYIRDEALKIITSGFSRRSTNNRVYDLLVAVSTIGGLFWLDYQTIRQLWPWLLNAAQ